MKLHFFYVFYLNTLYDAIQQRANKKRTSIENDSGCAITANDLTGHLCTNVNFPTLLDHLNTFK